MGRRNIRLRPVPREQVDMQRLAKAIIQLAAHQQAADKDQAAKKKPAPPAKKQGDGS